MFYDLFIGSFKEGDWMGMTLAFILGAIGLFLLGLVVWGGLYLIDSSYLQEQHGEGKIVDMIYHPEYTYTTFIHINKVSYPQIHHVPESWGCCIKVNGLIDEVSVSKSFFDRTPIGQELEVTFTNGRIWDSMYVKNFRLK